MIFLKSIFRYTPAAFAPLRANHEDNADEDHRDEIEPEPEPEEESSGLAGVAGDTISLIKTTIKENPFMVAGSSILTIGIMFISYELRRMSGRFHPTEKKPPPPPPPIPFYKKPPFIIGSVIAGILFTVGSVFGYKAWRRQQVIAEKRRI